MSSMDKSKEIFLEEARELLAELETSLLELEDDPNDKDQVSRVFRAMHTIKGSGAMFGYDVIAKFTHEIESAFDLVRNGKVVMTRDLVSVTLEARDLIQSMLESPDRGAGPEQGVWAAAVLSRLRDIMPASGEKEKQDLQKAPRTPEVSGEPMTYRIRFKPSRNIFLTGLDPASIIEDLQALGDCTVVASTDELPTMADMEPEKCYTSWDVTLTTDRDKNAIQDVFIFVQDGAEIKIDLIDADEMSRKKFGEILVDRGAATAGAVEEALGKQRRLGDILQESGVVNADAVNATLAEQQHLRDVKEKRQKEEAVMSVRVPAEKLDRLVDLVGEMVTIQARFSQAAGKKEYRTGPFRSIAEEVERLTAELRDNTMSIRMMPIGSSFSKFKRLVRDLSGSLGKEAELTTDGAETELDKTVIERLGDPLVHIIRNSLDHGIEMPEERRMAGKPAKGRVHLSAEHSGANVLIKIVDDGKGLDTAAIRAKAVEKGLIQPDAQLPDKELFAMIFAPGFSTAKTVTSVSGRGVGMDVVRQAINSLRGTIDIESEVGIGSTITLKLPLTLAIIDGFLTKINGQCYIFPLALVEECVELTREQSVATNGRNLAHVRGAIVPFIRLREHFKTGGAPPLIEKIVIARVENSRVGFVVDEIIGGHQTVIKNLGKFYQNVEGLSGATILGDGTVALIMDIPKIAKQLEREEAMAD